MSNGLIDASLPYIKREGVDRVTGDYASVEDADRAIAGLRSFYATRYPLVSQLQGVQVNQAIADLQRIYRLVATPEMRVTGTTYPNNLGHQSAPGCFRCHDGAHYKVVDGALTKETIPAACATCHTFPQIGATESGVLIGQRPTSHDDRLWVFDHKSSVGRARSGGNRLRRLPHPDLLRELPQTRRRQGAARRHDLQPRGRHAEDRDRRRAPTATSRRTARNAMRTRSCPTRSHTANRPTPASRRPHHRPPRHDGGPSMTINGQRIPMRPDWMTIHEASNLMGVSPATLRRWSDAGRIRTFTTPGGHRRFSRAAVARLLPAETDERPIGARRLELLRVAGDVTWFPDLDPAARRSMRHHARRISTAVVASADAVTARERAVSVAQAESAAADCAVLAAAAGVGLRETVEAFLIFKAAYLRAIVEVDPDRADRARTSAATMETLTDLFDRLVCRAMRAHEDASGRS